MKRRAEIGIESFRFLIFEVTFLLVNGDDRFFPIFKTICVDFPLKQNSFLVMFVKSESKVKTRDKNFHR